MSATYGESGKKLVELKRASEHILGVSVNPATYETIFTASLDGNPSYRDFLSTREVTRTAMKELSAKGVRPDGFRELLERCFGELADNMIMGGATSMKLHDDVFRASYGHYYFPAVLETEKERKKSESIGYEAEVFYKFEGNDIIARTILSPMSPETTLLTDSLTLQFPSSSSFGFPIVKKIESSEYKMRPLLVAPVDGIGRVIDRASYIFDSMGGAVGYAESYLELEESTIGKPIEISAEENYRNLRLANIMKLLGRDVSSIETRPVVTKG